MVRFEKGSDFWSVLLLAAGGSPTLHASSPGPLHPKTPSHFSFSEFFSWKLILSSCPGGSPPVHHCYEHSFPPVNHCNPPAASPVWRWELTSSQSLKEFLPQGPLFLACTLLPCKQVLGCGQRWVAQLGASFFLLCFTALPGADFIFFGSTHTLLGGAGS